MGRLYKDWSNQKVGMLTVIKPVGTNETGRMMWLTKCDCGNDYIISGTELTRKKKNNVMANCGCYKFNFRDLTGQKYGLLTVICRNQNINKKKIYWDCICDCGNFITVIGNNLVRGNTTSCGCQHHKKGIDSPNSTHCLSQTRLYRIWASMKARCYYKKNISYKEYGERGIIVCQEWKDDFMAFHDWAYMNGYKENAQHGECTLDRIDVNGNYEPSNCRWVNNTIQANNKQHTLKYTIGNNTKSLKEWCKIYNADYGYTRRRIYAGYDIETALMLAKQIKSYEENSKFEFDII